MRIAAVRAYVLDAPLERAFSAANMRFDRRQHCLVEITCDNGLSGWGECLGPASANAAVVRAYAPRLIGRDPCDTEVIWAELYNALRDQGQRGLTVTALSGLDIALWDLKGQRFGVSVSRLLGGRFRDSVQAYATGGFAPEGLDRVTSIAEECAGYAAQGFKAVKIKIGFDVEEDLAVISAVRQAIGPDVRLMVDANHGYDALDAVILGQRAAVYEIDWFEEPVMPEQLDAYKAVRAGQPLPVAGGETWHTRFGMRAPLEQRCVDILQPDVCGCGGFSEMKRICDLASLYGVRVVPHVWGTGIALAASLQMIAALAPDPVGVRPRAPLLEYDQTPHPYRQAMLAQPFAPEGGVVAIPDRPGLGIAVDRAALERFALKE